MATVRFGASLSLSGPYALQGRQALAGLRAWAEAANSAGGLPMGGLRRATVELIYYDDASSAEAATANTERLIQGRVEVLLGPYGSDLARAAAAAAGRLGRLLWNHGGADEAVHRQGARVVGVLTPVSRYLSGLLELARAIDPGTSSAVAIYRRGSRFGRAAARSALRDGRRLGLSVAALSYGSRQGELPRLLAALRRRRPQVVMSAGAFQDDVLLARALAEEARWPRVTAFTAAALSEFRQVLGEAVEGSLGPSQWEPSAAYRADFGPAAAEVADRIRAAGAPADYPGAQAYAAGLVAQRCLEEADSADDEGLWRAACALDCNTFFGRFRINPRTGIQEGHDMVWVQWQGGRKVVVWPSSVAQARDAYPRS